jgi:hypothetical protein
MPRDASLVDLQFDSRAKLCHAVTLLLQLRHSPHQTASNPTLDTCSARQVPKLSSELFPKKYNISCAHPH